jgi:hypothetical protein
MWSPWRSAPNDLFGVSPSTGRTTAEVSLIDGFGSP